MSRTNGSGDGDVGGLLLNALLARLADDPVALERLRKLIAVPWEEPVLLSVARAGELLGCSVRTVRRRIADGSLPAVLEAERVMIRGDELRAYVDGLERFGPAPGTRRTRAPRSARHDFSFLRDP